MNSLLIVVAVLFQFGLNSECSFPRLPASLSGNPNYNKYISVENDRIVGGTAALENEHPHQVSLQRRSGSNPQSTPKHFCGGSIISNRYIITAAHCTGGSMAGVLAHCGTNNLYDGTGTAYEVDWCKRHPDYNSSTVYADMSLCKTKKPIEFSEAVKAIAIAAKDTEVQPPAHFWVTGWGTLTEGGSISKQLMKVQVPYVPDKECSEAYDGETDETMICAGESGKDSCQGDSGGPLINESKGAYILAGIVSWGYGCARPNYPGVYTEVSKFTSFVLDTCNKDPDNTHPVSTLAIS